jgi:hypothetical protein
VIIDSETYKPLEFAKIVNGELLSHILVLCLGEEIDRVVIEMISSYGMPVGKEVFETVFWIGRYYELADLHLDNVDRVYRKDVKMHLCNSTRAKDGNISQALRDRFAYNVPNRGKGYKKSPAFFYGFRDDIWQAYALGVCYLDQELNN